MRAIETRGDLVSRIDRGVRGSIRFPAESLNAYRAWSGDAAIDGAEAADRAFKAQQTAGVLQGVPVSLKDLYVCEGYETFAGSPTPIPGSLIAEGDIVKQLKAQHAVITGKTHTVEFAFGGIGTNPHWGTPRNPWSRDEHRAPGGSSSGAGVSLWTGNYLALGTDTAGSVRVPASMTGTVGLKTSIGRWSRSGIVPLSTTFDTPGILARTVRDLVVGFEALDTKRVVVDRGVSVAGLRFGVPQAFFWEALSAGIEDSVREAISELEAAGAALVPVDLPELDAALAIFQQGHLAAPELLEFLSTCLPDHLQTLNPQVTARMRASESLPAKEYLWRARELRRLAGLAATALSGVDAMLTPTVAVTPPRLSDIEEPDSYRVANMGALRNTCIANLLELCAMSLPVGRDAEGMPVGLQLMARGGQDAELVATALAVERTLGCVWDRIGLPEL